jgi:hypothetical protein
MVVIDRVEEAFDLPEGTDAAANDAPGPAADFRSNSRS